MTNASNSQPNASTDGPLAAPHIAPPSGYTRVDNTFFDQLLPTLSGNGLKILLVALRQTLGWINTSPPTGHKPRDRISYSQFMEKGGMSRATVARAIKECLDAGVLLRVKNDRGYVYAVNPSLEPFGSEPKPSPGTGPPTGSDVEPLADDASPTHSGNELPACLKGEPSIRDSMQIGSNGEPLTGKKSPIDSGNELPTGSEDEPSTGETALAGLETEPPGGLETEHTKEKRGVVVSGATTNHILSRLKSFGLAIDQEVRDLAAQYTLPQVDYAVRRATQQAKRNPQGLLRTWMRRGHMPLPLPEECDCEQDRRRYHQLNDDARAFRRHQDAR